MSELGGFSELPRPEFPLNELGKNYLDGHPDIDLKQLDQPVVNDIVPSEHVSGETNISEFSDEGTLKESPEPIERKALLPKTGGIWAGEPGNSDWTPDDAIQPGDRNGTNPDNKNWEDIKKQYNFNSIPFKDGEADFLKVSKGEIKIDHFTDARDANFTQADEKLAAKRGCEPEEVARWRSENRYTWHECNDRETMMKVPSEVHGNIPHSGGISVYKAIHK